MALPGPAASTLPVLATVYPSWSGAEQSWRADKPMRPWFLGAAPCAIALALGVIALDPTAAGLGVPEIFPTHVAVHHGELSHDHLSHDHLFPGHSDPAGAAAFTLADSFGAWSSEPAGDLAGWTPAEAFTASWEPLHQPSHDWWA